MSSSNGGQGVFGCIVLIFLVALAVFVIGTAFKMVTG